VYSTANGCLQVGLSVMSSLLHRCGEESRGEIVFKQRKRLKVHCFGTGLSSGFGVLFPDISQACCVVQMEYHIFSPDLSVSQKIIIT